MARLLRRARQERLAFAIQVDAIVFGMAGFLQKEIRFPDPNASGRP